jgi:hypothetical protein
MIDADFRRRPTGASGAPRKWCSPLLKHFMALAEEIMAV